MSPESSSDQASPRHSPTSSRSPRRRRWRRVLFVSLGILVGLGIIVRLAAPEVLRRTAISQSSKFINGHIELKNIDLSVLTGRIEFDGLVVYSEAAPDAPLFRMKKLAVEIGWSSLFEDRIHVEDILLDRPEVNVAVNAKGRINWENLPRRREENPKKSTGENASQLVVHVDGASVRNAQFRFTDAQKGTIPPVTAELGSVQIAGFDLTHAASEESSSEAGDGLEWGAARLDFSDWRIGLKPEQGKPVEFKLTLHSEGLKGARGHFPLQVKIESDAGQIELRSKLTATPLSLKGKLTWTALVLPRLFALAPVEGVKLESGESNGQLEMSIGSTTPKAGSGEQERASKLALSISGQLGVRTLDLEVSGQPALTAEWEALNVGVKQLSIAPIGGGGGQPPVIDAALSNVELNKPRFKWVRAASSRTTPDESKPPAQGLTETVLAPAQQGSAAHPDKFGLGTLKVSDGSLRFEDRTLEPPFKYNVGQLEVKASDLEWPAAIVSKLDVSLGAGGLRPATLTGTHGPEKGRFKLEIEEIPLLPFNPYTHEVGVLVTQGTFSLSSDVALTGLKYEASNDVTLSSLSGSSVGNTFASDFGVPFGIAIALLEDPFGAINLAVPFEGDRHHGAFEVMRATGTAFRRALTNALVAPIKLLAATVLPTSDASRLSFTLVPFGPGQAKLSEFAIGQLENYAQVLSDTGQFHANLWPQINFGDARQEVPDFKWTPGEKKGRVAPDHPGYAKLMALAKSRANAVSSQLKKKFAVPEDRIQITTWTGALIDEPAGVRIGFSDGKLEGGVLQRAIDLLEEPF